MFSRFEGFALGNERGQATVEVAFALPVVMLLILLLLQPAILLYDRMVMQTAAAEGCRLLSTSSADDGACESFIKRRLGAVPQHELFHVHEGGCTWVVDLVGDESSDRVSVSISTEVEPLPLIGIGAGFLGLTNAHGNLEVRVESSAQTQPSWVSGSSAGNDPDAWIGAWAQ